MIILFILYNFFLHGDVLAGPLPQLHPALDILPFYPREIDPNNFSQRSEWNIVWSCFATLFACSWVATHPNIPAPSDGPMRIFLRRLMIIACMLLAPEFVIGWAGRQWFAARAIAKKHKDREWTTTHGFLASMGGFMLYDNGVMTQILVIERLEELASEGKIDWPSISKKEIEARSFKGDVFSKGFAVLQTTWFIAQCIARGVSGLIITQLEVTTIALTVLNGILYFLWWHKPQDVACPVPVHLRHPTTSDTTRLSKQEVRLQTTDLKYGDSDIPELDHYTISDSSCSTTLAPSLKSGDEELSRGNDPPSSAKKTVESAPKKLNLFSSTSSQHHYSSVFARFRAYFCQKFKDMGLFALVYVFIIKPFSIFWLPLTHFKIKSKAIGDSPGTLSVPTFYAPSSSSDAVAGLIGVGAGVLFGGIHCIASLLSFQSDREILIWRICAIITTVVPLIPMALPVPLVLLTLLDIALDALRALAALDPVHHVIQSVKSWVRRLHLDIIAKYTIHLMLILLWLILFNNFVFSYMIVVFAYFVSRIALLILPLFALGSLPPDSLLDIKWSDFIPHI